MHDKIRYLQPDRMPTMSYTVILEMFVMFVSSWNLRVRETHTQQVSDEWTYFRELVFFPFSSDVYRGQKEQTKNNDYIHNGA